MSTPNLNAFGPPVLPVALTVTATEPLMVAFANYHRPGSSGARHNSLPDWLSEAEATERNSRRCDLSRSKFSRHFSVQVWFDGLKIFGGLELPESKTFPFGRRCSQG
jgi:hypothetical protein